MNKERILRVANAIESVAIEGLGFNMVFFIRNNVWGTEDEKDKSGHNCGTVACIAGYAVAVASRKKNGAAIAAVMNANAGLGWDSSNVPKLAQKYLGLDPETAGQMFYGYGGRFSSQLEKISHKRAVAVLRKLAATGEVDWDVKIKDYVA